MITFEEKYINRIIPLGKHKGRFPEKDSLSKILCSDQ